MEVGDEPWMEVSESGRSWAACCTSGRRATADRTSALPLSLTQHELYTLIVVAAGTNNGGQGEKP